LGEKAGKGFFLYHKGKQGDLNPDLVKYLPSAKRLEHEFDADMAMKSDVMSVAAISDACLIPMLVEALRCLAEKVVDDAEHLDAAFVYGIGFPPFRGGLLRYFASFELLDLKQRIESCHCKVPDNLDVLDGFRP